MSEPAEPENLEDAAENETEGKVEEQGEGDKVEEANKNTRRSRRGKKKTCDKKKRWTCEDTPLWRVYMKSYLEREKKLERDDKLERRRAAFLPRFPKIGLCEPSSPPSEFHSCFPLNTFNLEGRSRLPDKSNIQEKVRIWRRMKEASISGLPPPENPSSDISRTKCNAEWPGVWPCVKTNLAEEQRQLKRLEKRDKRCLLPCQVDTEEESDFLEDFADRKELGHARIPITCPRVKKRVRVDRAVGKRPGLVDGDCIVFLFGEEEGGNRSYAEVCLRGAKGMHLAELSNGRAREKTWKFCFYQAIVALLAKTQLRYKFAWSANVDYIFDHAWMLFVHMGSLNVKERIRLDDVVVYNYKYSVELELVHETRSDRGFESAGVSYAEEDLVKMYEAERPELMKDKGESSPEPRKRGPVHESTRDTEKWFEGLSDTYRNCILRCSKFSMAFWKDGVFWYLYNPYRCDEFGFWCEEGYACLMKFCSRDSLKRHLMILLLRAYSYDPNDPKGEEDTESEDTANEDSSEEDSEETSTSSTRTKTSKRNPLTIQIFQMIYHCVQIQNVKLLQKAPSEPRRERVKKKQAEECGLVGGVLKNPLDQDELCEETKFGEVEHPGGLTERSDWLEKFEVSWARFSSTTKRRTVRDASPSENLRWHQFYVEEPHRIFTLWAELHPNEEIFPKENRGQQIWACYVVCAGMTRIQAPEYWSSKTLDAVIMCGDRFYTMSKMEADRLRDRPEFCHVTCWSSHLGKEFKIGDTLFEARVLPAVCGRLYNGNGKSLWETVERVFNEHHFGILTCESSRLCLIKFCGAYYVFDAHSFGPPLFQFGAGVAYLVRATSFFKFMTVLVLTIGSSECSSFSINPIEIGRVVDLGTTDLQDKRNTRRLRRLECPFEDATKATGKRKPRVGTRRTIDKVSCRNPGC